MQFNEFVKKLRDHFTSMVSKDPIKVNHPLFEVDMDKDTLWNLYLDSFPEGTNLIYKTRREYDCNCCKGFIRKAGSVVVIKSDYTLESIWDLDLDDPVFGPVCKAMAKAIKERPIVDHFYINQNWLFNKRLIGVEMSFVQETDHVTKFEHLCLPVISGISRKGEDVSTARAGDRNLYEALKSSLTKISIEAVDTVLELISQNSLYRGQEWEGNLKEFRKIQVEYDKLSTEGNIRDNFIWTKARYVGGAIAGMAGHSMGVLLKDITEGEVDLDQAVRKYEAIVAPSNYKRPRAIYTKRMLEEAKKTLQDLGYLDSLQRRFASLGDITVNNILFANRDTAKKMAGDIFEEMAGEVTTVDPRKFSKVEEIGIKDFIEKVLPTSQQVEVLFEGKHISNLVSLITAVNKEAPSMFKWGNNFSWAYNGNIADSMIKQNVEKLGGNVTGVLRFSIMWNDDTNDYDGNDLDAHCHTSRGGHIYFGSKVDGYTGGNLDVDIINPTRGKPAVENIAFPTLAKMPDGEYQFSVNCYSSRGGRSGFKAEIEFDGQIYYFEYNQPLRQGQTVQVAAITKWNDQLTIRECLKSTMSKGKEVWGIKTNQFIPVSVLMYSPNYWDDQDGIGNRHYFFMMKDCINPDRPNGFYNEFLDNKLTPHRKVFEALGGKMAVEENPDQLSGIGFSSTQRASLVVKVKGQTERILRVNI